MVIASVLLAAGYGRRLRPLTNAVPKAALPMLDVPLGAFALADLVSAVPPVVVNSRTPAATLTDPLRAAVPAGWEVFEEGTEPLGAASTLAALGRRFGPRLVTRNADLLTDLAVADLLETHERAGAAGTIAVMPVPRAADLSVSGGRVEEIFDRRFHPHRSGATFLGMAVWEKQALELLAGSSPLDFVRSLLVPLADARELAAHVHDGYAVDVGTPARYLQASIDLLEGRGPRPPRPWPGDIREAPGGRSYVARDARVDGTLRAGAIILAGAVVERDAAVENALVWPGQVVRRGTFVRNEVFAPDLPRT